MLIEATLVEKKYTVEEYFELEKTSEIRHEFVNGVLIPMPGESKIANKIAGNVYFRLRMKLKMDVFEVFNHDVRTMLEFEKLYRYPDIVVAPIVDDEDTHAVTKPVLIVEVFSENSIKTDTIDKLREYSSIPSMQYYLIVSQTEPFVEVYARNGEKWEFSYYTKLDEMIPLPNLQTELGMKEIFEGVFK